MGKFLEKQIFGAFAGLCLASLFCGCTSDRSARDVSFSDIRVFARYEVETDIKGDRVEGEAEISSWFNFIPDAKNTSGGYFSDVGSLFSGLSPTQSLALRAAVSDACKKAEADYLLMPRYDMHTTSVWFFYESASCNVSGIPVKIKKIRQVSLENVDKQPPSAGTTNASF